MAAHGPLPLINQLHSTQRWKTAATGCTTHTVQCKNPCSKRYEQMFVLLSWQMDVTYCIKYLKKKKEVSKYTKLTLKILF